MEYIDDDNDIKQGDELITSGQDQIYPKGISLGVVISVKPGTGSFKAVRIRPSVNFSHLEEVLCITERLCGSVGAVTDRITAFRSLAKIAVSSSPPLSFRNIGVGCAYLYVDLPLILTIYYGFTMGRPIASVVIGTRLTDQDSLSGVHWAQWLRQDLLICRGNGGIQIDVDRWLPNDCDILFTLGNGAPVSGPGR
jgi:hypothetical protein